MTALNARSRTNWTLLLSYSLAVEAITAFGSGEATAKATIATLKGTEASGEFRNLLALHGTQYARRLARKALSRRGIAASV